MRATPPTWPLVRPGFFLLLPNLRVLRRTYNRERLLKVEDQIIRVFDSHR